MVVCRFFLEGRCRYGDRCYNEHIIPRQQDYQRYESPRRDYQRYDSPQPSNRYSYESPAYRDQRYNSPDYRPSNRNIASDSNPNYQSPSRNQGGNKQNTQNPYQWRSSQYESPGRNQGIRYEAPSTNNRFDALNNWEDDSSSGKGSYNQSNRSRKQQYENTSSFHKVSQADGGLRNRLNDADRGRDEELEMVKEEVIACEMGQQWPFSCYSPSKGALIPDLNDVSPEELRYQAYEAQQTGTFSNYVETVAQQMSNVKRTQEMLKNPTPEMALLIKQIASGELQTKSTSFSFTNALRGSAVSPAASLFFGKTAPTVDESSEMEAFNENLNSAVQKAASTFSFKLPESQQDQDSSIYTSYELLNKAEKEAFSSATFVLKKIPTRPPPKAMCF